MDFDSLFPHPIYLNLGKRQDRRLTFEAHLAEREIRARRFPAVNADAVHRDHGFANAGRYAHDVGTRLAIREALRSGAENFFLFEDDAVIRADFRELLAEVELPDDWGLFYLGCQHIARPEVVGRHLLKVARALDTHAWGCRRDCLEQVYRHLSNPTECEEGFYPAADVTLSELHAEIPTYAIFPNIAWQAEEHSDLAGGVYSNYHPSGPQICNAEHVGGIAALALAGKGSEPAPPTPVSPPKAAAHEIAFLFLTRGEHHHPEVWTEYWEGESKHRVYGHAADPSALTAGGWLERAQIESRVENTRWGDISLVRAQLALLRAAFEDERNGFFLFLSESCVPIRPIEDLSRLLEIDRRSRFGWVECELATAGEEKVARAEMAARVPSAYWRFHSQWVLLNREAAELVLREDFTELFSQTHAPDEAYFGTVLELWGVDLEAGVAPADPTWTRWSEDLVEHPTEYRELSPEIIGEIASSGCFFARKFARDCDVRALTSMSCRVASPRSTSSVRDATV